MAQERILVVDDEPGVRGIVASLLEYGGYRAETADGAEQALARLREEPACDVVVTDVMMPDMDGLSLLDRIGADHPGMPVVLVTAMHNIHVATNAFRRGAIDYLLKPFDRAQLLEVVSRAVERGRLGRESALYRESLEEMVYSGTGTLNLTLLDLERSYDSTLEALGDALDLRHAETEGHSKRVTAYAVDLARAVGLDAEQLRVIARGAFLHDIGKIATPDRVLLKPGKLDPHEVEIMRQHCRRGYEMVRKIPFLREASEIVYAHQESFDGGGYPRGLSGEAIPLGARIFAIADTLDAITSDRPYRKARSFEEAREEIARQSGKQFDPALVEIFLGVPSQCWRELRAQILEMPPSETSSMLCRPAEIPCGALCDLD